MATTQEKAAAVVNAVRETSSLALQRAVPQVGVGNWGDWYNALMASPALENEFRANLINYVYEYVAYKASFANKLGFLKKGEINNGAGIREQFVAMVDVMPYITSDVERQELKRYITDMFEAVHLVNMKRVYPATIGRVQFREMMATEEGVLRAVDLIKDSIFTSSEWDEYGLTLTLIQRGILDGKWKTVKVNTSDPDDFVIQLRTVSGMLTEPRREWNAYGVANNTPADRQIVMMTYGQEAKTGVKVLASAFNISEVDYLQRRITVSAFDKPFDAKRLAALREANPDIPDFTAGDLSTLSKVVAVVFDERLVQLYDFIHEMWEKQLASTMEINYFYHLWQIFSLSPFSNCIVMVDDSVNTDSPSTITATVDAKVETKNGYEYSVSISTDGIVGGAARLIETDELAEAGVRAFRSGVVQMTKESAGGNLVAELYDDTYTAATAITKDTAVGATIVLNKNA